MTTEWVYNALVLKFGPQLVVQLSKSDKFLNFKVNFLNHLNFFWEWILKLITALKILIRFSLFSAPFKVRRANLTCDVTSIKLRCFDSWPISDENSNFSPVTWHVSFKITTLPWVLSANIRWSLKNIFFWY